jgi:predicted GNAT family acetyltransferase
VVVIQGVEAMLEYHLDDQNIDFYRALVPLTLRRQGIAEKSVRTGLAWAKTEGLNISTRCSYVVNFLR